MPRKGEFGSLFWDIVDICNSRTLKFKTKSQLAKYLNVKRDRIQTMIERALKEGILTKQPFPVYSNKRGPKQKRKSKQRIKVAYFPQQNKILKSHDIRDIFS